MKQREWRRDGARKGEAIFEGLLSKNALSDAVYICPGKINELNVTQSCYKFRIYNICYILEHI